MSIIYSGNTETFTNHAQGAPEGQGIIYSLFDLFNSRLGALMDLSYKSIICIRSLN